MSFAEPRPDRDGIDLWWVEPADDADDHVAAARGLVVHRRLHQLRRPLPLPADHRSPLRTRPFRPGEDDAAWLAVNAAAFRDHPDQGRWTEDDLAEHLAAPWFEAAGFLLHEVHGRLAGFCWTKLHPPEATPAGASEPALGEIFVVGVRPDLQGRGLGRSLTTAGLRSLWDRHRPPVGMLYVESTNVAARAAYAAMGFARHHDRVAYRRGEPAEPAR